MMQATDFADWDNHAELGWVDRPPIRCIFGEGEVCSGAVVIAEVASQDATQVALAEDDNVVETVAPDRADKALRERIRQGLCGAVRTSSIRMPFTRWRNCSPYTWSRSRRR